MAKHDRIDKKQYTVKFLTIGLKDLARGYQEKFGDYLVKRNRLNRLHLGIKYLGAEEDFTDKYMLQFIPKFREIARKYLPLKLSTKGLTAFWESLGSRSPVISLNIMPNKQLKQFHNEIRYALEDKVDSFPLAEGDSFHPHISIGVGDLGYIKELEKIVKESKKEGKTTILVRNFAMRLKGGKTKYILKS